MDFFPPEDHLYCYQSYKKHSRIQVSKPFSHVHCMWNEKTVLSCTSQVAGLLQVKYSFQLCYCLITLSKYYIVRGSPNNLCWNVSFKRIYKLRNSYNRGQDVSWENWKVDEILKSTGDKHTHGKNKIDFTSHFHICQFMKTAFCGLIHHFLCGKHISAGLNQCDAEHSLAQELHPTNAQDPG